MQINIDFKTAAFLVGGLFIAAVFFAKSGIIFGKFWQMLSGSHHKREMTIADQPIAVEATVKERKAPQRFSYSFWDERHTKVVETLREHEERLDGLEVKQGQMEVKIEQSKAEILIAGEERKNELQQEIGCLNAKAASMETASQLTNQRIVAMDGKLDRLIERLSGGF